MEIAKFFFHISEEEKKYPSLFALKFRDYEQREEEEPEKKWMKKGRKRGGRR